MEQRTYRKSYTDTPSVNIQTKETQAQIQNIAIQQKTAYVQRVAGDIRGYKKKGFQKYMADDKWGNPKTIKGATK